MMLIAALASAWAVETTIPFERELVPPKADYPGTFDRPPIEHWRIRLPGRRLSSASNAERSSPVVAGEEVFVGTARHDAMLALSRSDGRIIHQYPAAASVQSSAVVENDRVYFSDTGGRTWCYERNGDLIWEHDSKAPILVRPTVHEGRVYVTNVNDLAVALDADTGELAWRYQAKADVTREAELALYGAPPAVIVDDDVLLGFSDGTLTALNRERGDVTWSRRVGEGRYPDLVASPVADGRDVFAAGYYLPLLAIDRETQNVRWRVDVGAASAPLVYSGDDTSTMLYHPGTDGKLRAIITLTGAEKWTWDSGGDGALSTPVRSDAGLLVGSSEGGLYLVDPETGDEIWRYHGHQKLTGVTSAPVVAGRQLFFLSNAGYLYSMLSP